ncbi:hypothetical protein D9M68_914120 [compost metagenome]
MPGTNSTSVVRANWMYQFHCMPIVASMKPCTPGMRCDPISRRKTGRVSAAAMLKSRVSSRRSASFFSARSAFSSTSLPVVAPMTLAS